MFAFGNMFIARMGKFGHLQYVPLRVLSQIELFKSIMMASLKVGEVEL